MTRNVHELRSRAPETEKITINLGYVDLGQVDLMVQEPGTTPTAPISFERRSVTNLSAMRT